MASVQTSRAVMHALPDVGHVREVTAPEAKVSHNLKGQKRGRKGQMTRERIIAATVDVLRESDEIVISLSAVARKAKLGMTSLYVYFADLT